MKRLITYLCDRYAWYRWGYLFFDRTFTEFRTTAQRLRADGGKVYSRGVLAWLGNS